MVYIGFIFKLDQFLCCHFDYFCFKLAKKSQKAGVTFSVRYAPIFSLKFVPNFSVIFQFYFKFILCVVYEDMNVFFNSRASIINKQQNLITYKLVVWLNDEGLFHWLK